MPINPDTVKTVAKVSTASAIAIAAIFIPPWEGYLTTARHDPIDPPGVITVCNGITNYDIPGLTAGMKFTKDRCDDLFAKALPKYAAPIDRCVKAEITNHTRAALYSAGYNLGPATVCKSSMVRRINAGDLRGGCDALLLYTHANGVFIQGLLNRRRAERTLCLTPDTPEGQEILEAPAIQTLGSDAAAPLKITPPASAKVSRWTKFWRLFGW